MPVFRVTGHSLYEVLVSADLGIGEGPAHFANAVGDGLLFQSASYQSSFEFVKDVSRP